MKHILLTLLLTLLLLPLSAQTTDDRITRQKRVIADLEARIAREEQEISRLKKGRASAQEQARRLAMQLDARNQLMEATEQEALLLGKEIDRTDSIARGLGASLEEHKRLYAEMVREAWRNYRHNNYLTYLFSSEDFGQVARRIANLRGVASMREHRMEQIATLSTAVADERSQLEQRRHALDSVKRSIERQRTRLKKDEQAARASIRQLSERERRALAEKVAREQQLDVAIGELRKLTKGNREGSSFTAGTGNLRLPVVGGRVKRYKGNMAEICGPRGAKVQSIYEGKVIDIKRNRITGKYDVYIAHGEYLTSYANLGSIDVQKGAKVARNEAIGTIGSAVNLMTMETEYKLVFGIYAPTPEVKMLAENCFK
ncbi:murein hydrolase activator EnvC family protein [Alistipes sp.]|uniref:murein hydrolase activator EnvC family protein n=1 Tax=Alistipes sp. TaxID=1872444 RepID=UPI003AB1A6F6